MERDTIRESVLKKIYGKDLEIYTKPNDPNVNEATIVEMTFLTPKKNEYKLTEYLFKGLCAYMVLSCKNRERLFHDPIKAEYEMMCLISEE